MSSHFNLFIKALALFLWIAFGERMLFLAFNGELIGSPGMQEWWRIALWGARFDAAIAANLVLISFLVAHAAHRLFRGNFLNTFRRMLYLAAALLILVHAVDTLYYAETGRHMGYELLNLGVGLQAFVVTVQNYFAFLLLQFALLGLIWLVIWWVYAPLEERLIFSSRRIPWYQQAELQLVGIVLLSALIIRGGIQSPPLEPLHAQEIGSQRLASMSLNGAYNALYFSLIRDSVKPLAIPVQNQEETAALFSDLYHTAATHTSRNFIPYNIILILLDGWPAAYMSSYGASEDSTPYFDSLRRESLTTYAMLAGGLRTTEGMFATLCSTQNPLGQSVAQSELQNFEYPCLPNVLRAKAYNTAFFQGSDQDASGIGSFAQSLGFAASYDKRDIEKRLHEENAYGVHDPDLYKYALEKIKAMPMPFLVGINTNSTRDQSLPQGVAEKFPGEDSKSKLQSVLHFSDESLRQFMASLTELGLLDTTLVVMVADHAAPIHSSNFNNYAVPFLIHAPDIVKKQFIVRAASQRDIVPTVLDILGHAPVNNFTGKSLLRDDQGPYFADYYHAGVLGWIEDDTLIEIPIRQTDARRCYDFRKDPLQEQQYLCPANNDLMANRALAFTKTLQAALYNGELSKVTTRPANYSTPFTKLSTTGN